MNETRCLLFDLDNTLMDRDATFRSFASQFVKELLSHLPQEAAEQALEEMIVRDADGYRDKDGYFAELSEVLPWNEPVSAAQIRAYYDLNYFGHGAPMRHAKEILDYCRGRGYTMGLVTNGKTELQYRKIDLLGIRPYFTDIVISGEVGISKPDPDIYRLALERLGAAATETLFIGDHPVNDIWGAAKAGMQTIWLKRNHAWDPKLDVTPWKTIRELDELTGLI
ncbi:HAD family hydrolase [Paenibacillus sp. NFR01]|uniref:HAD family hydrolase n=1 Tax=Paenibacillus sp. NFR01 TaxID=1566279 RepID=UPI0008B0D241|nr:HAD family hydrolase [Paenibacillus sp. NFR01]SET38985.1 putative hydrolase of the HAD superfamily [Paenibacillus sp. NFR01]